jgi:hypothetical protein
VEPRYPHRKSPSKLDDYELTLTSWLFRESRRHRKQRRDALLCAMQAGWAWMNRSEGFGIPSTLDPLEGWIADPSLCN